MDHSSILVYSPELTNRIRYAFDFMLQAVLGVAVRYTASADEFQSWVGPKCSYGHSALDNELFFYAQGLLQEKGLGQDHPEVGKHDGMFVLYPHGNRGALPFDLFAGSFYLLSRYEEYQPHSLDVYNRFPASASLASQKGFLQQPVVDQWAVLLGSILTTRFPSLKVAKRSYSYITTIDVDNAYEYLEKGLMRTLGAYARSLLRGNFTDLKERTRTLLGMEQDSYDSFAYLHELEAKYDLEAIYFFLVGDYGLNDKNVPISSRKFQSLIKTVGDQARVGVHPSFMSNSEPHRLGMEINRLEKVLHHSIDKSRQHFLKLDLPTTYRRLIEAEIKHDYTMGYAAELGFRAGTCTSFPFYDLDMEQETGLMVHPFCFMEATLKYYKSVPPEEAMSHIKPIVDSVKAVNGTCMSLWHNDSLSETKQWVGWRSLYEEMIQYAKA